MKEIVQILNDKKFTVSEILFLIETLKKKLPLNMQGSTNNRLNEESLVEFLLHFWDYNTSPYVTEKKAYNQTIGKKHCYGNILNVHRYYYPYFLNTGLKNISKKQFKDFIFSLETIYHKPLSAATKNKIVNAGSIALRWAYDNNIISENPTQGIRHFSMKAKKRGILTKNEAVRVFKIKWSNEKIRVANFIALSTGLRAGEILALRWKNIENEKLHIEYSYSLYDGIKSTKTGETRIAILTKEAMRVLAELKTHTTHTKGEDFIFLNEWTNKLFSGTDLRNGLREALETIGISCEEQKKRNIVFHSWRHFYSTILADKIDARKVQLTTGHKSAAVFEEYTRHSLLKDIMQVQKAANVVFQDILLA